MCCIHLCEERHCLYIYIFFFWTQYFFTRKLRDTLVMYTQTILSCSQEQVVTAIQRHYPHNILLQTL